MTERRLTPLGDSAITVTAGDGISETLSDQVVAEAAAITNDEIVGVIDVVPSYASVTVHYDPLRIGYTDLRSRLLSIRREDARIVSAESKTHVIPVDYVGEDLAEVAQKTQLSVDQVIAIHSSVKYRVFVIGFVPGFAYLGTLDPRLVLPRRESPRKRVPAGSVAIAEAQTGIYPAETPGGWHLIGITGVRMFDPSRKDPALLAVGDRVRFEPS
jgi:KipI family sensor histidine kinase inhibitor